MSVSVLASQGISFMSSLGLQSFSKAGKGSRSARSKRPNVGRRGPARVDPLSDFDPPDT